MSDKTILLGIVPPIPACYVNGAQFIQCDDGRVRIVFWDRAIIDPSNPNLPGACVGHVIMDRSIFDAFAKDCFERRSQ